MCIRDRGIAAGERIFTLLDVRSEVSDHPAARTLTEMKHGIAFREAQFSVPASMFNYSDRVLLSP